MSEPTKPRFTVDLEEIDRQLRRSAAPSAAPWPAEPVKSSEPVAAPPAAPTIHSDPLAELARIVGQEDPFQSILAQPIVPQRGSGQSDPHAPRQPAYAPIPPARTPEVDALAELLRSDPGSGAADFDPALSMTNPSYPSYARQSRAYEEPTKDANQFPAARQDYGQYDAQRETEYSQSQQPPHQSGYDNFNPSYDDPKLGYSPGYAGVDENYLSPAPKSRKKLFMYGGVAAACLLAVFTAYGFMRSGGISGNGEAPLVTASTEPTKVPPEAPGGKEFPDQNKQIYERNNIEGKTQIVNREEQPVDVQQAARSIAGSSGRSDYGEPRKVRTVAVGPDGTVIGGEAALSAPRAPVEPAATLPTSTGASPNANAVQSTPAFATEAPSATTTPAEPVTQPVVAPAPPRRPATLAATTSEPAAQAAAITQAATTPASAGGGFVVQFGVSGNEAEGVAKFRKLQNQHPDLMADVGGSVRPAEVNGKTIFRVRSVPMSKEASDTLCSKLKAAGTECYVARN